MIKRSAAFTAATLSCGLVAAGMLIPSAGAKSASVPAGPMTCVMHLVPTGPPDGQGNVPTRAQDLACSADQHDAIAAIDASNDVHIGKDWEDWHQQGDSLIWTGDRDCTNNYGYDLPEIGSAWDERISSSIGKNGCNRFKHFEGVYYSGSLKVCTLNDGTCWEVGAMNDQTTSEKWRHE